MTNTEIRESQADSARTSTTPDVGLGLSLMAFPAFITLTELYRLIWPPYSDEALRTALVDTWQLDAMYALSMFWVLVVVFVLALCAGVFARRSLRGFARLAALLALAAICLLAVNDHRLTAHAELATGMNLVPALDFLSP
jgi:hypothetical protein